MARIEAGDPATIKVHGGHSDTGWWDDDHDAAVITSQEKARRNVIAMLDMVANAAAPLALGEASTVLEVAYGNVTPLLHHVDQPGGRPRVSRGRRARGPGRR